MVRKEHTSYSSVGVDLHGKELHIICIVGQSCEFVNYSAAKNAYSVDARRRFVIVYEE